MSFLSLGETSNLTTGTNIPVGIDGGWPLWVDLTQPGPSYNGHYGSIPSHVVTVQHSLMVAGGHVPGVAVIVGVIGALSMMTEVHLLPPGFFGGDSGVSISSQNWLGRVAYSYGPQFSVTPAPPVA
jgi:hypothetical protein